jgi:dCMP deaminase
MSRPFLDMLERETKFHKTYMQMAKLIAELSYCSKRKVGALIVKDRNIVAYGFNGTVNGMPNICEGADGKTLPNVVHAEMNAVIKAGTECNGADMYITLFPCEPCVKLMAQSGIKTVFYLQEHKPDNRIQLYGMCSIKIDLD